MPFTDEEMRQLEHLVDNAVQNALEQHAGLRRIGNTDYLSQIELLLANLNTKVRKNAEKLQKISDAIDNLQSPKREESPR